MLCKNAPVEFLDRETLWNSVMKIEKKRKKEGADEIIKMSRTSTKNVTADSNKKLKNMSTKEKQDKLAKAAEARKKASKGSLSAGANLVQKFNSNETDD